MSRNDEHIDEHILAAFLTGDLPPSLRREIAAYIARNERARDLLTMATDVMEDIESGDGAVRVRTRKIRPTSSSKPLVTSQQLEHDTRLWKIASLFAVSVLLLAVTVGLFAFEYRSNSGQLEVHTWVPAIAAEDLALRWPAQPDAVHYQIMVQNQRTGMSALVTRTENLSYVLPSDAVAFQADTPYKIWVLALDAGEKVLSRSEAISVFE